MRNDPKPDAAFPTLDATFQPAELQSDVIDTGCCNDIVSTSLKRTPVIDSKELKSILSGSALIRDMTPEAKFVPTELTLEAADDAADVAYSLAVPRRA